MVIIKCNAAMPDKERRCLEINIHDQAADGVIVLPYFCDLLTVTPDSEDVQIMQKDDRVAELEQELDAALLYISAKKDCDTCKHEMDGVEADACPIDCQFCDGIPCNSKCQYCYNGSNWEWRGAHV